jgi:hypothetical protein
MQPRQVELRTDRDKTLEIGHRRPGPLGRSAGIKFSFPTVSQHGRCTTLRDRTLRHSRAPLQLLHYFSHAKYRSLIAREEDSRILLEKFFRRFVDHSIGQVRIIFALASEAYSPIGAAHYRLPLMPLRTLLNGVVTQQFSPKTVEVLFRRLDPRRKTRPASEDWAHRSPSLAASRRSARRPRPVRIAQKVSQPHHGAETEVRMRPGSIAALDTRLH